jgi:hypothetical protein
VIKKQKIVNDPVHGFITVPGPLIHRIIETHHFQRLRRIRQLGLTHLVYPGAMHTRFNHSLGAMHLMQGAVNSLRHKGIEISKKEEEALYLAILLHDVGHGPFSHALEHAIVSGTSHEDLSLLLMEKLNLQFDGELEGAINIFSQKTGKHFLSQLVSGQIDMDRLDYLGRDSFFCGVAEGIISQDRIIKTLNVHEDELVVEYKGIYSIEKFLIARRLMYWQVYLHKTVIAAEYLLMNILRRAKFLLRNDVHLFTTPPLEIFLKNEYFKSDFESDPGLIEQFCKLDDFDIASAVKVWCDHPDKVLSHLSNRMTHRKLFAIEMSSEPFEQERIEKLKGRVAKELSLADHETGFFVYADTTSNYVYDPFTSKILILMKDGSTKDVSEASDQLNISVLSKPVTKYFLCYPKEIRDVDN